MKRYLLEYCQIPILLLLIIFFSCKKDPICSNCNTALPPGANKPPVAHAGFDQIDTLPLSYITLNGSNSFDPDSNIVQYEWSQITGQLLNIVRKNFAITWITNLRAGIYTFELKVTDAGGLVDKDTVQVKIVQLLSDTSSINICGSPVCLTAPNIMTGSYFSPPSQLFPGVFGAATSCNNKAFFGGGHEEGAIGNTWSIINIYNNISGAWESLQLSIPRSNLSAATAGNFVLFAGGNNIASINPVYGSAPLEFYDKVDIYSADNYSYSSGQLSEKRGYMASIGIGEKAFFIGGKTINGFSSKMDVFNSITSSWEVINLPRERGYAAAAIAGDKIYISGGKNNTGNLTITDVYDLTTSQWLTLQTPHEHPVASATSVNNKIFIAGGDGLSNRSIDIYDISTNTWESKELSDSRFHITVASANNKILFLGGILSSTNLSSKADFYDANTNKWYIGGFTPEVAGLAATVIDNSCLFMGFLLGDGNMMTNSLLRITL